MYSLSFAKFMDGYVRQLSLCEGGWLRRLAREAESGTNSRLLVPLMVLAAVTGRTGLLAKEAAPGGPLARELDRMRSFASPTELVAAMREPDWTGNGRLPVEYYKVWESYVARALEADDGLVRYAMRERVLAAQATSGESGYSMAKATGLDRAAVWDVLARGSLRRLSRGSLRLLVEHAESVAGTSPEGGLDALAAVAERYREEYPERQPRAGRVADAA